MKTMTVRSGKLLLPIALALLVAGCASSPLPRYFRLAPAAELEAPTAQAATSQSVIIGPFQLAEYLDRPQIVSVDGSNGLLMAEYDRWAEPLDANFQAVVAANVGRLLGSDQVLEFPAQTILKAERRVTGRVSRFDVEASGLAVLEVQWGILDSTGAVARPGKVSRYESMATGQSTDARVAALNATVTAFSTDLAVALR